MNGTAKEAVPRSSSFSLPTSAFLYGIVDLGYVKPEQIVPMTEGLIAGGSDILKLRAKGHPETDVNRWGKARHTETKGAD